MKQEALSYNFARQLALIKYLFGIGLEQSRKPEPFCVFSILTFHDAVELFLALSSLYLNVGKTDINFLTYWELLDSKLDVNRLTQKESMRRLNSARVALKHSGAIPAKVEVENFRANTTDFFNENTPIVFGIEFASISLVDLVQSEEARNSLKEAQEMLVQNKIEDGLDKVVLAFDQLIADYQNRNVGEYGNMPFHFGRHQRDQDIRDAVEILCLGIDYRRYAKFSILTYRSLIQQESGDYEVARQGEATRTSEDLQFCIDFVIESAINLQDFQFRLEERWSPRMRW
jgi:hypothetical protein